ncbi:hypothetical protein PAERUG_P54_1_London_24_VIM_2_04_13_05791 [Pseudomonas aeruginosa]|nr:hypothetical protein PAERUG_P54_1_London_24_VIM_2_04_13_05791 [Pseudomonas aeruginosa]
MGGEGLQATDLLLVALGDDPADAYAGRDGLGETRAVDHPAVAVVGLERARLALVEHQFAVDVVLDHPDVVFGGQFQQLLLAILGNRPAEGIAQPRGQHQGLDRPLVGRQLQRFKADPGARVAGDLDDLQAQHVGQLQQAVVARRLGGDQVAGTGQHPQGHVDRIHAAVGDGHLRRVDHHAGVAHADRHLPPQRLETGAEHVAERPWALEAGDLGQLLVQGAHRQVVHVRHRRAEREYPFAAGLGEHLVDDAAAGDQAGTLDPRDIRGRRGQRRGAVDVEAGLRTGADQSLVLEGGVGLQHGGVADVQLGTELAHRRYPLARLVDATANVLGQLLGDALVKQQIGHGGFSSAIEPKQ